MARFDNPLDKVRVAAPCNASWEAMVGDYRSRFCGQCNLNVYNLSSMSRSEAESLIARTEGRLCVRFFRRADGSILTEDCPVGLRAVRRRISYVYKAIASAVLSFFAGLGIYHGLTALSILDPPPRYQTVGVLVPEVLGAMVARPVTPVPVGYEAVMGGVGITQARPHNRPVPKRGSR
jgi:hypothetical protein